MANIIAMDGGESGFNVDNMTCWVWLPDEKKVQVYFCNGEAKWAKYDFVDPMQFIAALKNHPFTQHK